MYQKTNMSAFIGRAGEYAVASQLLLRGIQVNFPAVDKDVDLIAGWCRSSHEARSYP